MYDAKTDIGTGEVKRVEAQIHSNQEKILKALMFIKFMIDRYKRLDTI